MILSERGKNTIEWSGEISPAGRTEKATLLSFWKANGLFKLLGRFLIGGDREVFYRHLEAKNVHLCRPEEFKNLRIQALASLEAQQTDKTVKKHSKASKTPKIVTKSD